MRKRGRVTNATALRANASDNGQAAEGAVSNVFRRHNPWAPAIRQVSDSWTINMHPSPVQSDSQCVEGQEPDSRTSIGQRPHSAMNAPPSMRSFSGADLSVSQQAERSKLNVSFRTAPSPGSSYTQKLAVPVVVAPDDQFRQQAVEVEFYSLGTFRFKGLGGDWGIAQVLPSALASRLELFSHVLKRGKATCIQQEHSHLRSAKMWLSEIAGLKLAR